MIAAGDPQEFIPGGRQQALRHPGPWETPTNNNNNFFEGGGTGRIPFSTENFIVHRLEKVSLTEASSSNNKETNEWWTVRNTPKEKPAMKIKNKKFNSTKNQSGQCFSQHQEEEQQRKNKNKNQGQDDSSLPLTDQDSWSIKSIKNRRISELQQNKSLLINNKIKEDRSINTNSDNNQEDERRKQMNNDSDLEEELYVKNNIVIWSKGLVNGSEEDSFNRTTICAYSSQFNIKQALWVTFYLEMPMFDLNSSEINNKNLDEPLGKTLPSLVIMDSSQKISVYLKNSEDFTCTPPFPVRKLWNCKFGLLLEREEEQDLKICVSRVMGGNNVPFIFSMGHPLDEVSPVALFGSDCDQQNLQIVFVSEEPSICMAFDASTGQHFVFKIRRAPQEQWVTQKITDSIQSLVDTSNKIVNRTSAFDSHMNIAAPNSFNSRSTSVASVGSHGPSRSSQSPMAAISRCQSPAMSPYASLTLSPWLSRTSKFYSSLRNFESHLNITGNTTGSHVCNDSTQIRFSSLNPHICFEQVWMDSVSADVVSSSPATKVFLSEDLTGQWYLCYLIPARSQLSIVKIDIKNLTFGLLTSISALDAVPISSLKMTAILEHSGNVVLYSGLMNVGKLHIGGVLAQHVPSPCVMRNQNFHTHHQQQIPQQQQTKPQSSSSLINHPHHSPFPRRSSLLPHHCATPKSSMESCFDEHLISPVLGNPAGKIKTTNLLHLHLPSSSQEVNLEKRQIYNKALLGDPKAYLNGLRESIGNRLTLCYSDGTFYRTTLPKIASSSLVESCLNALKLTLTNKDALITLITRWYARRNAPGPSNITNEKEFELFTNLLSNLIGYEIEPEGEDDDEEEDEQYKEDYDYESIEQQQTNKNLATPSSLLKNVKRKRKDSKACESDWNYLLNSQLNQELNESLLDVLNLNSIPAPMKKIKKLETKQKKSTRVNTKSILFPFLKIIHFTLHLLYEDLKLDLLRQQELPLLSRFLHKLSVDLQLEKYQLHYWKDFPELLTTNNGNKAFSIISESDLKLIYTWPFMNLNERVESVNDYLTFNVLRGELKCSLPQDQVYPHIKGLNDRSFNVLNICCSYIYHNQFPFTSFKNLNFTKTYSLNLNNGKISISNSNGNDLLFKCCKDKDFDGDCDEENHCVAERIVLTLVELGITKNSLDSYPIPFKLIFYDAIYFCRENPPGGLNAEAYKLLDRFDLAVQVEDAEFDRIESSLHLSAICSSSSSATSSGYHNVSGNDLQQQQQQQSFNAALIKQQVVESELEDGMDDVDSPLMKLRFNEDLRVGEVRKLLQSAKPVPIVLVQRPDVSDHDFFEEQEKHLYAVCTRTMALPVGRGMFTLRTVNPVITEPLINPPLCLTGKAPPRGTTVELTHIDTPQNMNLWPLFHNGVANGLRVTPDAQNINSSWIIFNKPKGNNDNPIEHGGFLMGLGLNGHLRNLSVYNTYDYLAKTHEMTSVGILLGLSTAFRGTSNQNLTKMISLHVEALLPPTSMELDVPQNLQVASLLSIGLLYQQTGHRHMIEVLLTEIGRPPGPEMENSVDRESYSLAAGLALGLVNLKQGGLVNCSGISDLNVPDALLHYMVGGNKRLLNGSQKDKYKLPSFQIREGNCVNLDVTAPGATLALGLMYLQSGNKAVADWMAPPSTQYLLDFVRPDFLMLRMISRGLILWEEIEPNKSWIENQVPENIRPHCMVQPTNLDIDYEAMNQAYCNIIAGACFALGLKYAGSADEEAFQTLLTYCKMFTSLTAKSIAELAGKPTIETCLNVILLSASMVMCGTGNLDLLRIIRHLRRRVGISSSAIVTYGSHLATHMALGLLFLGGGRYTLSNSPSSIAALICAFYPKFPTHSNDNRYHLQAFRHLYVLAVEARLFIPKDVMAGKMCYAKLRIFKTDNTSYKTLAPTILPDLNSLNKVAIEDERYWTVTFERGRNWDLLLKILKGQGCVNVKQRAGCLSYQEDKTGFRVELAQTITKSVPWDPPARAITSFSSDLTIRHFTHQYLIPWHEGDYSEQELKFNQTLTKTAYEAVIKDKIFIVPMFASLVRTIRTLSNSLPTSIDLQQFKLSYEIVKTLEKSKLISRESVLSLKYEANEILNQWEPTLFESLKHYLNGTLFLNTTPNIKSNFIKNVNINIIKKLALYIIFYEIPYNINNINSSSDILTAICDLQSLNVSQESIDKVLGIKGIIG